LNHNQSTREALPLLYNALLKVQTIPDSIVLVHEFPSEQKFNEGFGIRLLYVRRDGGEDIIATAGDLMLSFIPRWRSL